MSYLFSTRLHRHLKQYKRQHNTRFTHSPAGQRQRHVYYLTSDSMDELNNLIRIEELCRNLREQQEQQRQQSATATG